MSENCVFLFASLITSVMVMYIHANIMWLGPFNWRTVAGTCREDQIWNMKLLNLLMPNWTFRSWSHKAVDLWLWVLLLWCHARHNLVDIKPAASELIVERICQYEELVLWCRIDSQSFKKTRKLGTFRVTKKHMWNHIFKLLEYCNYSFAASNCTVSEYWRSFLNA